jgi:hypothetical protein
VVDAVKATGRYDTFRVVDASGAFTKMQGMLGVMRMMQAGVVPVAYSNVAVELLADNAAPEAQAVYGAIDMPFTGLNQYFSQK